MELIASYIRVTSDFLMHIKSETKEIEDVVFQNVKLEDREFDIDKAWHGIYFLLTGIADLQKPIESLSGLAIFGGTEIGSDLGYGPLRYLEVEEVKDIANALEIVSVREFATRYKEIEINKFDIYPFDGQWTEEDKEYLVENFKALVEFYRLAANQGEACCCLFLKSS
ncbi:YfbM family protein [Ureibacillus sp. GCM10028918]|uniref:YfbM family protein n=1 Tax=Ureibacillus sp. GCM10028918 TaxID=3273429 RepID=UPI0036222CE5